MQTDVFLLLGCNLGDKKLQLEGAIKTLGSRPEIELLKQSSIWETAAWGHTQQPSFYNCVLKIKTSLNPEQLLDCCLEIERMGGRVRNGEKWGPRLLDIDILYYGMEIIKLDHLKVPHPQIVNRRFTLEPICEIAAEFTHPVLNVDQQALLNQCKDDLKAKKLLL